MTFRCQACNEVSEHGVRPITVVMEERTVLYPARPWVNKEGKDDPGGQGVETVSELRLCEPCAELVVEVQ